MLVDEISSAQRLVRTDAYQMSLGEIVSMYENNEIVIHPDFQRLFRWSISQKSKLIESLLLGIPLPPIFVFETEDGKWELIDGLQRISTILEFMGLLKTPEGERRNPSVLEATRYLPSLHNVVWESDSSIDSVDFGDQLPLDKSHQLAIRRARISVEILKRPSDNQTKFDLFQRLNAGGTQANAQELRNCIMLMVNASGFREIKLAAEKPSFLKVTGMSEDQIDRQRHMEFAVRFLVHANINYDGSLDVEEYVDEGIVELVKARGLGAKIAMMVKTFDLLYEAVGKDALRKFDGRKHVGKVGLVGLEGIAVGIGKNIRKYWDKSNRIALVKRRIEAFWQQDEAANFTSPGLRGTIRIQRTVPFGVEWFEK